MRALVLLNGYQDDRNNGLAKKPTPLSTVLDRPFIFHIIESLVKKDITDIHIIEYPYCESIRDDLKTGDRWGINITYHLAEESKSLFNVINTITEEILDEQVVLGFSTTLPNFDKEDIVQYDPTKPILFCTHNQQWTGWGILRAKALELLPSDLLSDELLYLLGKNDTQKVIVKTPHSIRSLIDLHQTNVLLLNEKSPDLLLPTTAHQVERGIWISRNVVIYPHTKLIAPVYIGENCQIRRGTVMGPGAIIEKNCFIDSGTRIRDSVICEGSYIGIGLEVEECIIDKHTLTHIPLKTVVDIQDNFILGSFASTSALTRLKSYLKESYLGLRSLFKTTEPQMQSLIKL